MRTDLDQLPCDTQAAANGWLRDHGDTMMSYAVARVGDLGVAEDLLQETFVAAMAAYPQFRGESTVRTWLIGILRRQVADHFRRESRRPQQSTIPGDEQLPAEGRSQAGGHGPSSSMERAEFQSKLDDCLKKLPKSIAGAFVLRAMDEISPKELCNAFGISATNLRVRLHRARMSLRDCLEKYWR